MGIKKESAQSALFDIDGVFEKDDMDFENAKIALTNEALLKNKPRSKRKQYPPIRQTF
ncbi:MAG: hypothetical protein LBE09_06495 [Christensenellaceae bacterium]|nr:hypothetical protein [Christensenellaceae bacterium]